MKHESYENIFEISETQDSFSDWLNKPYISSKLQKQLSKANLLIIPDEEIRAHKGVRNHSGQVFPTGTEELFLFFKDNANDTLLPEICVEDDDYVELVMHWDLFTIGNLIVSYLVAPLTVNLIYDFLKIYLGSKFFKTHVKLELTIEKEGESTHVLYEGPAEKFHETILPSIEKLSKK